MSVYLKDPDAVLDYANDWSSYLAAGETLTSSVWAVEEGDGQLGGGAGAGSTSGAVTTSPVVTGGTKGEVYSLRNRITTSQGRTDDRTHTIRVEPR